MLLLDQEASQANASFRGERGMKRSRARTVYISSRQEKRRIPRKSEMRENDGDRSLAFRLAKLDCDIFRYRINLQYHLHLFRENPRSNAHFLRDGV